MDKLRAGIFHNFGKFAKAKYSYEIDIKDIEDDLKAKIAEYPFITNKAARRQLDLIILPTVSIYKFLISHGIAEDTATKWIREYVLNYYKNYAKAIHLIGRVSFFYSIFRWYFPTAMRLYPTEFWKIKWIKNSKDELAFNMTDCLYYKTFKKYQCQKLTLIYCGVDHFCYDHMSKKVKFIRTGTLGNGNDICDFRFVRAK